jgi:hypothetical protein
MKGPGGKGQGKPGRGKDKGKGKGKGSGAGVGSTYANPGRPKRFQPTQQDRQRTGDIAGRVSRLPGARKTANLCSRERSLSMCAGICIIGWARYHLPSQGVDGHRGVCHVHSDCIGAVVAEAADVVDRT